MLAFAQIRRVCRGMLPVAQQQHQTQQQCCLKNLTQLRFFGGRSIDASMTLVGVSPSAPTISFESNDTPERASSDKEQEGWARIENVDAAKTSLFTQGDNSNEEMTNQQMVSWVNSIDLESTIGMSDPHQPQYQSQDAIDLHSLIRNRHSNILPEGELARITSHELKDAMEGKDPRQALEVFFSKEKVDSVLRYVSLPVIEEVEETPDFPHNKAQGNSRMLS